MIKALVTGGARFIGSSLSEALVDGGWEVTVLENLSTGSKKNLEQIGSRPAIRVRIAVGDCTQLGSLRNTFRDCETIFHCAANPEFRMELTNLADCFRQNVYPIYVVLGLFRQSRAETVVFASSSTVYGEPNVLPCCLRFSRRWVRSRCFSTTVNKRMRV